MAQFRFVAALLLAGALACSASKPTLAGILIQIDKRAQTMTVAVDGQLRYRWRVSTGATGYSTPRLIHSLPHGGDALLPGVGQRRHAPRDFLHHERARIHGSDHPGLGTPVSHGCVRLTLPNATTLYQLVQANGMGQTKVVVRGPDPPGVTVPSQPPRQRARGWQPFRFFQF